MNKYIMGFILMLPLVFSQCTEASRKKRSEKIKQQQYYVAGQKLYEQHCSSCHQTDGSGLNKLIPPISPKFIKKNTAFVICGIKHGISGPLQVGDILFDNKMPDNQKMSDIEIAEIMTFIQSKWSQKDTIINTLTVNKILSSCKQIH